MSAGRLGPLSNVKVRLARLQELRRHNSKCPVCRSHVEQMLHIAHLDKSKAAAGASGTAGSSTPRRNGA